MLTSNNKTFILLGMLSFSVLLTSCDSDDDGGPDPDPETSHWLDSNVDALGTIDLGGFTIPDTYVESGATTGSLAPANYNGQITRLDQLEEIADSSRNEPIYWDMGAALSDGSLFAGTGNSATTNIYDKTDENDESAGDGVIADKFVAMADSLVAASQAHYTVTAANGTAGMITTGTTKRHVSAKGLEYIQLLEKGLYGACFYDQMVDDYLPTAGSTTVGNNTGDDSYATQGTARQHDFDEVFGYFGGELTYPNPANASNGDGRFIANYTFDFSDETLDAFGVDMSQKITDAFIFGRSVLKAGEGLTAGDESTNETYMAAAIADVKVYTEAGIAAAAFHYLNDAIADLTDEDKLHHLSEALAFIYALSFSSDGIISPSEVHNVLIELGWSSTDASLTGVYDINLWEVTDEQMQAAKDLLDQSFVGFGEVDF